MQEPEPPVHATSPAGSPLQAASIATAWIAGLLAAEGCAGLLYVYWGQLEPWVQGVLLAVPPLLLWGGYAWARHRGIVRNSRLLSVPLCISWLSLLLIVHFCVAELPLLLMGLLFMLGAVVPPFIRPAGSAFIIAAVGCLVALGLQAAAQGAAEGSSTAFPCVQLWCSLLAILALWAQAGAWCGLTSRSGYAGYAFLAPLAWGLFLLLWVGGLSASIWLHAAGAGALLGGGSLLACVLVWLLPVMLLPLLHLRWARHVGRPVCTLTSLVFGALNVVAVPLGYVSVAHGWLLLSLLLLVAYGFTMSTYGLYYACLWLLPAGCVTLFAPTVCLLLSGAWSVAWCGGLFLLLSVGAMSVALWLHLRHVRHSSQQSLQSLPHQHRRQGSSE